MANIVKIKYNRHHPDGSVNEFQRDMFEDVDTKILMGDAGVGSGKSFELCQKMLKLSFLNRGFAGGLLIPSFPEYFRDIVPNMEDILEGSGISGFAHNQQKKFWRFPWSTKPLYVFTAEKRIKGPNLGWGGVNEYSSIPEERMEQFLEYRVRVPCPHPQVEMVGTPEDDYGWRDEFVEKNLAAVDAEGRPRLRLITGNTMMNAFHLRPGFVEEKRAVLDPLVFKMYIMGIPMKLNSKAFYYAWQTGRENCLAPGLGPGRVKKRIGSQEVEVPMLVHVSLDFNVGNMSAVCANVAFTGESAETRRWRGERDDDDPKAGVRKRLDVFDVIQLKDRQSDTWAMGNEIKKRFGNDHDRVLITGDASGASRKTSGVSDFQVLEDMGFKVRWKAANTRLRARQNLVNGLIHHGLIRINPEKCKALDKDLQLVEQDEKTFAKVKSNPDLTHLSDALDYLCDFEFELGLGGREKFTTRSLNEFLREGRH